MSSMVARKVDRSVLALANGSGVGGVLTGDAEDRVHEHACGV
jgi:hypothetical protein